MVLVQSVQPMVQQQPYSRSLVPIGRIRMVSKIIHSTVCFYFRSEIPIELMFLLSGWTHSASNRMILAFSVASTTQLLLPATNDNASSLQLIASIRDNYDSVTEYQLESVFVEADSAILDDLIENIQNSTGNSFVQLLGRGNQNTVSQVITSISQHLNTKNDQTVQTAISSTFFLHSHLINISSFARWHFSVDHCHIIIGQ